MTRIFHWFFMWKMDLMSGFDIRLVFTLPPRDSTLQYKTCVLFCNNFPCIIILVITLFYVDALNSEFNLHWNPFFSAPRPAMQSLFLAAAQCSYKVRNAIFFNFCIPSCFLKLHLCMCEHCARSNFLACLTNIKITGTLNYFLFTSWIQGYPKKMGLYCY